MNTKERLFLLDYIALCARHDDALMRTMDGRAIVMFIRHFVARMERDAERGVPPTWPQAKAYLERCVEEFEAADFTASPPPDTEPKGEGNGRQPGVV